MARPKDTWSTDVGAPRGASWSRHAADQGAHVQQHVALEASAQRHASPAGPRRAAAPTARRRRAPPASPPAAHLTAPTAPAGADGESGASIAGTAPIRSPAMLVARTGLSPVMVGRSAALARLTGLLLRRRGPRGRPPRRRPRHRRARRRQDPAPPGAHPRPAAPAPSSSPAGPSRAPSAVPTRSSSLLDGLPPAGDDRPGRPRRRRARIGDRRALVVFEDLHWADAESVAVFERLAACRSRRSWSSARTGPTSSPGASRRARCSSASSAATRSTTPPRAPRRAPRSAFLASVYHRKLPRTVIDTLYNRTGGNPFFLEEILNVARATSTPTICAPAAAVVAGRARAAPARRPLARRAPSRRGGRRPRPAGRVRRPRRRDRPDRGRADRPPAGPRRPGPAARGVRGRVQLPPRPRPRRGRGPAPRPRAAAAPRAGAGGAGRSARRTWPRWPTTPAAPASTTSSWPWPARGSSTTWPADRRHQALRARPRRPPRGARRRSCSLVAAARAAWLLGLYDEALPRRALAAGGARRATRGGVGRRPPAGAAAPRDGPHRRAVVGGGRARAPRRRAARRRGPGPEHGLRWRSSTCCSDALGGSRGVGRAGHRRGRRRRRQAGAGAGAGGAGVGPRPTCPAATPRATTRSGRRSRGRSGGRLGAPGPGLNNMVKYVPSGAPETVELLRRMREAADRAGFDTMRAYVPLRAARYAVAIGDMALARPASTSRPPSCRPTA